MKRGSGMKGGGLRVEVEGNGDPHCRGFSKNQTFKISQDLTSLRLGKQSARRNETD